MEPEGLLTLSQHPRHLSLAWARSVQSMSPHPKHTLRYYKI